MEFLFADWLGTPAWFWLAFIALVVALTAFDLGILNKENKEMGIGESLKLSLFFITIALAFGAWIWIEKGGEAGLQYYTGFFIEKALSIDNVFVISLIFSYFAIPAKYQYRALLWGIVAVIVLRGLMIAGGAALLSEAYWVLYIFAAFLVLTGIKMWWAAGKPSDLEDNPALRLLRRVMPVSPQFDGERFFTWQNGRRVATPLLLVVALVGVTDVIFAVDSIPAIFAITLDPFIVLTSNVFAILGLRAMYFLLRAVAGRFHLLTYGLAVILVFIGTKMMLIDIYKIPVLVALGVVVSILAVTMVLSVRTAPAKPKS